MKAYHNQPELKQMIVEEAIKHRESDQVIKGSYERYGQGDKFQGCAVGCTLHSVKVRLGKVVSMADHNAYETELGVPVRLAYLEDRLFERLPDALAQTWPQRFLEAIPVGADLSRVSDQFLHWLLVDEERGVVRHANTEEKKSAIRKIGELLARRIAGGVVTRDEFEAARSKLTWRYYWRDAAADAAADAADAADAAADAAAAADWRRYDKVWNEAREKSIIRQSEKLLELLAAAPVETNIAA